MKILAFTPYKSMIGGANRSLLMVLKGLKEEYNHDILVAVPGEDTFSKALEENGIRYITAPIHEVGGVFGSPLKLVLRKIKNNLLAIAERKNAKKFAQNFNEDFDIVYINDNSAYFGSVFARIKNLPYVWHFRSFARKNTEYAKDVVKSYEKCCAIITISDGMKEQLNENKSYDNTNIVRIHNGIPLDGAEKSLQTRENGFHFVQCGRITKDKGHIDSISAIGELKKQGIEDIYLHIVGAAPSGHEAYFESIKAMVVELGLEKQVSFEGTRNDMPDFRKNMNGELMCSLCEPFGRVTLEGMRSGLVVIGSNTGGTPEIITDKETGLLYKQGDYIDLAEKIRKVYDDEGYAKALADKAYEFSTTHFTPEINIKEIERVLKEAVKE